MLAAAAVLALPNLARAQDAGVAENTILARVNGMEIRRSDVNEMYARLPPNLQSAPPQQIFPAILDQLIRSSVVASAGRAQDLQDSEAVKAQLQRAEDAIIGQVYISNLVTTAVTDETLRARYDDSFGDTGEVEVRASHILLENEADALAVIEEITGGADFAALAAERSVGPSAGRGGDLGYFRQADMVAEFATAAFAMETGESSAVPVETQFGWHVIMVVDRRASEPPPFETVQDQLRDEMSREVIDGHLQELLAGATIERFDFDGAPLE